LDETCDTEIIDQITWIKEWLLSFEIPVFVCSGNHDVVAGSTKWLAQLPYSDGSITKINNITIGCAPEDCEDFHKYRNCDILLHHYPPSGSKTATDEYGNNFGNFFLKQDLKILNCTYLLCGHIHQPIARRVRRAQNPDRFIYNAGGNHKRDKVQHLVIEI
jgi:Icc-related predicted phosphoesterase